MQFRNLFDDERAVSPVIGVILMVAITVILAAVIGTFVLGLGDQVQQTTPQAQFGFDTGADTMNVTVTHESGDTIDANNLQVSTSLGTWNETSSGTTYSSATTWNTLTGDSEVNAGSSVKIGSENSGFSGETIRVIYDNPDSDKTATLAKFEV